MVGSGSLSWGILAGARSPGGTIATIEVQRDVSRVAAVGDVWRGPLSLRILKSIRVEKTTPNCIDLVHDPPNPDGRFGVSVKNCVDFDPSNILEVDIGSFFGVAGGVYSDQV